MQMSMLGGFYLIISFFLNLIESDILEAFDTILLLVALIWGVALLFVPPRGFLIRFRGKFPKISVYLIATGWTLWLLLPVLVMGYIYGYNSAMALYDGAEYDANNIQQIMSCFIVLDFAAVIVSLIVATVIVIKKEA